AQEVKQQQQAQAISINYMEKQLETQVQMRDLLKMIVNKLDTASPTQANDPVKAGAGSNGMGETKPSVQERRPGTNPVPLSFKRLLNRRLHLVEDFLIGLEFLWQKLTRALYDCVMYFL